jgi:hypothetical protein
MPLTLHLDSLRALFHKLERESYRAHVSHTLVHKADHFLNFCMTAHAMRDYFFAHKRITEKALQSRHHVAWNSNPALVAAAEIANTAKHFTLRDGAGPKTPRTRDVTHGHSSWCETFVDDTGTRQLASVTTREVFVTLSDGTCHSLRAFTDEVLAAWQSFLAAKGIRVRRLSPASLSDTDNSRWVGRRRPIKA